jgi:tetratricopeptide (TPR) repeat protein
MLMFKQGRLDDAVRLLDDPKVSAEDPFNALLLASSLANLGVPGGVEDAVSRIPEGSPARPIARAAELQLAGRRAELLSYATDQRRRTGDPIWSSVQVAETTLMGEYGSARAAIPANFPGTLRDPPDIAGYREMDVLLAATALQRTGAPDKARQVLEALLGRIDGRGFQAADQLATRAMTLAALGRRDEAIAAFDRAAKGGWRMVIDFDYFARIGDYPFMADVARDPRFRQIMKRIEADLARMRDNVLRWRAAARQAA